MDKKERKQRSLFRRISKSLNNDNTTFEDILKNLDTVVSGNNYGRDLELEKLNDELKNKFKDVEESEFIQGEYKYRSLKIILE